MARKILILDWKGPSDKIALAPRVVDYEGVYIDIQTSINTANYDYRFIYPTDEGYRCKWKLLVSCHLSVGGGSSLVKNYIAKLIQHTRLVNRVMLFWTVDNKIQDDLRLNEMPEEKFAKYIEPLLADNFYVEMARLQYTPPSNALSVILEKLYTYDVEHNDETRALVQSLCEKLQKTAGNIVIDFDIANMPLEQRMYLHEAVIKTQPAVYQKYIAAMSLTIATPDDINVDFD